MEPYARWPWSWPVQAARVAFVEGILRPLVAVLGRPRVERSAAGVPEHPCLYVANHVTAVDVPLVLAALPRRVRDRMAVAMSAELLASWKQARRSAGIGPGPLRLLGPLQALAVTALLNTFPLPAGAGLRASFAHAGEALDRGFNVLVFPEGRRSQEDALQEFQTGIGILAQQSGAAVVPVALAGLYGGRQKTARFTGRAGRRVAVRVGQPLWFQPGESPRDFTGRLQSAVKHLISVGGEG